MAFNLGNAVGAWFGGLIITFGLTYRYLTLPAAVLTFAAMSALLVYGRLKTKLKTESVAQA